MLTIKNYFNQLIFDSVFRLVAQSGNNVIGHINQVTVY